MIVKNEADTQRWIENQATCGVDGEFCSQSCHEHGSHVAISGGRVFARGLPPQRETTDLEHNEMIEGAVTETVTFGRSRVAA